MADKRKSRFCIALLAIFAMTLSLFGFTAFQRAGADAAATPTEISWPAEFGASAWSGAKELRIPTTEFLNHAGDTSPTADNLAKVKIVSGSKTYKASNIYVWEAKLTFYFNGTAYDGTKAVTGDKLVVGAGLKVTAGGTDFNSTDAVTYTFNGTKWLKTVAATGITVENEDSLTVKLNETLQLNVTLQPEGSNEPIVYQSLTAGIATVNASGLVTGVAEGSAQIKITAGSVNKTVTVAVQPNETVYVKNGIKLTANDEQTIYLGQNYAKPTVVYTYEPENANPETVAAEKVVIDEGSFDKNTINVDGYTLTAKVLRDGSETEYYTVTFTVKVLDYRTLTNVSASWLEWAKRVLVDFGTSTQHTGNDAANQSQILSKISFTRVGDDTVKVDSVLRMGTNLGIALKKGSTTLIGTDLKKGDLLTIKKDCEFLPEERVKADILYVYDGTGFVLAKTPTAISGTDQKIYIGKSGTITFTTDPADSNVQLTYSVDDPAVASIASFNGKSVTLSGIKAGAVKLTATFGSVTKQITVTVEAEPTLTGIEVSGTLYAQQYDVELSLAGMITKYVYSDGNKVEFTPTREMIGYPSGFSFDNAGEYTLTLTSEGKTANVKLVVAASKKLTVESITMSSEYHCPVVVFKGAVNTENIISGEVFKQIRARMLPFIDMNIQGKPSYTFQGDAPLILGKKVHLSVQSITELTYKPGDTIVFNKGMGFLADERLAADEIWVYDGKDFKKLVEPTTFEISSETPSSVRKGSYINILVSDADSVTAVYKYSVNNTELASIDAYGKLTAKGVGSVTVTVTYKDISKTKVINILAESEKTGLVLETNVRDYYVPRSTADKETSFVKQGYKLTARYTYADGNDSESFSIENSEIGAIDYTTVGTKELTVTDKETGFTAKVNVIVYDYRYQTMFDSLGVSGYDVSDDRNTIGTWNGHMIVGMQGFSTNLANLLSTPECTKMAEYIEYQTADGNVYVGTGKDKRVGVWMLGYNMLVMIKPEGSEGNKGYSKDRDVYLEGDKVIFKKGMPLYAWKGEINVADNNKPVAGKGCMIIEGYLPADIVYSCYEEDGEKSLWQYYKDYNDFTVNENVQVTVGKTASVGAIRVPVDATTGKFTYVSSDPSVVTVNENGNMVGMKVGTATITITLTGGKDAGGNLLEPIVKTVTVTVKNGITKIEGAFEAVKGSAIDLSKYELKVTFSDGSTANYKLSDSNVTVEEINADTLGEASYNVSVTVNGETKRGTITFTITEAGGCAGCGSGSGTATAVLAVLGAAALVAFKKRF